MQRWLRMGKSLRSWTSAILRRKSAAAASCEQASRRYAYRMRSWPVIPQHVRTASVLRTMARMSCGPVTHAWILSHCGLSTGQAECLLDLLIAEGVVERIDFCAPAAGREAGGVR